MDEITNDIVDEINELEIYCPDCRYLATTSTPAPFAGARAETGG